VSNEKDVTADEPSNRTETDELLECLVAVAAMHHHDATREALVAGLPLEEGKLTPGVLGRAATRADLTARLVKSRLSQLNPALFPVILLLEAGRACVLLNLDLKTARPKSSFPSLAMPVRLSASPACRMPTVVKPLM